MDAKWLISTRPAAPDRTVYFRCCCDIVSCLVAPVFTPWGWHLAFLRKDIFRPPRILYRSKGWVRHGFTVAQTSGCAWWMLGDHYFPSTFRTSRLIYYWHRALVIGLLSTLLRCWRIKQRNWQIYALKMYRKLHANVRRVTTELHGRVIVIHRRETQLG